MRKIFSLSLIIGLIVFACSDPDTIGLEIQPSSDSIIISSVNFEDFNSITESEDSLRTDETANLILGEIDAISDPEFFADTAYFTKQQIMQDNAAAILAQANKSQGGLMTLVDSPNTIEA